MGYKFRVPIGFVGAIESVHSLSIENGVASVDTEREAAILASMGFVAIEANTIDGAQTAADLIPFIKEIQAELASVKAQNEMMISRASVAMKAALGL